MAAFCTNCGAPLAEGAGFCIKCGAPRAGAAAPAPRQAYPPQQPAYAPPPQSYAPAPTQPVAAKSSSGVLKIVLIVVGVFVALGAIGIFSAVYIAYRVKSKVTEEASRRGVDLSAYSRSAGYQGRLPNPCSLLTTAEASEIIGVTIERTEEHGHQCDYYTPAVSQAEQQERIKKSLEEVQARSKQPAAADAAANAGDAAKLAQETGMADLTKNLVAGANDGSTPYFSLEVNENGRAAIATMKLAMGAVSAGVKTTESLSGIGDEALMGPMDSMMLFTKNGLGVQIDLRQMPKGRERAIAMAQRILPRL